MSAAGHRPEDTGWVTAPRVQPTVEAAFCREPARVVTRGGRLAFFDILAGPNQPIHFPVPWATDPSFSFLRSPDETRALLLDAGFHQTSWLTGVDLRAELDRAERDEGDPDLESPLDSGLLNGPDGARMAENVARNLKEGRILPVIGVFERG